MGVNAQHGMNIAFVLGYSLLMSYPNPATSLSTFSAISIALILVFEGSLPGFTSALEQDCLNPLEATA